MDNNQNQKQKGTYNVKIRKNNIRIKYYSTSGYKYREIIPRKNDGVKPIISKLHYKCTITFPVNNPNRNINEIQHIEYTRRPITMIYKDHDNLYHRIDGPAITTNKNNGEDVRQTWYIHGDCIREEIEDNSYFEKEIISYDNDNKTKLKENFHYDNVNLIENENTTSITEIYSTNKRKFNDI